MYRATSLVRAWAAHIAELPLVAMQNDMCAVDYDHLRLFEQNVIAQGMRYTSLSDSLDVHEHIALDTGGAYINGDRAAAQVRPRAEYLTGQRGCQSFRLQQR